MTLGRAYSWLCVWTQCCRKIEDHAMSLDPRTDIEAIHRWAERANRAEAHRMAAAARFVDLCPPPFRGPYTA